MCLENRSATDILLLLFVSASIPIYILFLLTLIVYRKTEPFNSHFFLLSISLGVVDLAQVIHSYLFVRIPGWGCFWEWWVDYGTDGSFLSFYGTGLQFSLSFAQHLCVALIGLNRLSKMGLHAYNYDKIWSGHKFTLVLVVQWLLPAIMFASIATQSSHYFEICDNGMPRGICNGTITVNIDFVDGNASTFYFGTATLISLVANVATLSMYAIIFTIAFKQRRRRIQAEKRSFEEHERMKKQGRAGGIDLQKFLVINKKLRKEYARELKLAFSGFATCISMLIYFAFLVTIVITRNFQITFLWDIASDLFSCINPFTLLLMSEDTRRHFFHLVLRRKL